MIDGNLYVCLFELIIDCIVLVWMMVSVDVVIYGCEVEIFCFVVVEVIVLGWLLIVFDCGGVVDFVCVGGGVIYWFVDL